MVMLPVRQWSDARPAGRVMCCKYRTVQCQELKTGQQKIQLFTKTSHFAHLGILFIYGVHCTIYQYLMY